ncbi:MAG: hypothetical protein LBE96_20915 [Kalamiella piersonii]|uniref:hypothetical protein n=1 Tax=Pantoea piersonii TaxID=2364647 RepID=UPI00242CE209|nr:hypothetical protein [Pantoea piersonii]MBZ6410316.1 hypothetical protein [Pantoea piersonii]
MMKILPNDPRYRFIALLIYLGNVRFWHKADVCIHSLLFCCVLVTRTLLPEQRQLYIYREQGREAEEPGATTEGAGVIRAL